jgi:hypothetical protein
MKFNFKYLVVAILVLALLVPTFAVSAKTLKFTFTNVTFSDGTQGVIEAGTKQVGSGSTYTVCDYYTSGYETYLGQYQDANFFSSDAATVEQFCLDHYADRTLP